MATRRKAVSLPAHRARMTDVAAAAGVSMVTVSRAINTPDKVAAETLAAVRSAIARLGYSPNLLAGSLASNRSRIVGAIVPTISNLVFSETIEALAQTLAEAGYQLLLGQSFYRSSEEAALIEAFLGRRVDGLVLTGCGQDSALRGRLRQAGVPVVQTWDLPEANSGTAIVDMGVGFSNVAAGRAAARHLLERGYRALGFIGAQEERSRQRLEGFRAEAAQAGVGELPAELIRPPAGIEQAGPRLARLFEQRSDLRAVFCNNDLLAAGALFECHRRGWAVPQRLAIMGFGDMGIAEAAAPQLSTVRIRRAEIGERAGQMLLARLQGQEPGVLQVNIGFDVVTRGST